MWASPTHSQLISDKTHKLGPPAPPTHSQLISDKAHKLGPPAPPTHSQLNLYHKIKLTG